MRLRASDLSVGIIPASRSYFIVGIRSSALRFSIYQLGMVGQDFNGVIGYS